MKAQDFRVGNIIHNSWNGKNEKVSLDVLMSIESHGSESKYKPIQLTEEILVNWCGGIDNNYTIVIKVGRKKIEFNWSSKVVSTGIRYGWHCKKYRHIKYLHQLQNLYHSIYGKELTINHPSAK